MIGAYTGMWFGIVTIWQRIYDIKHHKKGDE